MDLADIERGDQAALALFEHDLPPLWEHAQRELIAVLVQKSYKTRRAQERLLKGYEDYLRHLVEDGFRWRRRNPTANLSAFLAHPPPFSLSMADEKRELTPLTIAYIEAYVLANYLRQKLPKDLSRAGKNMIAKNPRARATYKEKKRAYIQEAMVATFQTTPNVPPYLMDRWVWFSVENIAQQVSAWRNRFEPSSLKRHGHNRWKEATRPQQLGATTLLRVMRGDRPAFQTFRENLLHLQARILPSYKSFYLPTEEYLSST